MKGKYSLTNKAWTEHVLGVMYSHSDQSPFGEFFIREKMRGFTYRNEDGDVDMSLSNFNNFEIRPIQKRMSDKSVSLSHYPSNYNILIEHENDITRCHEEIIKLTYYKSILKVLITYNFDAQVANEWVEVENGLVTNYSTILHQTNRQFPENKETEYLLIVGQMQKYQPALQWTFVAFESLGNILTKSVETEFFE